MARENNYKLRLPFLNGKYNILIDDHNNNEDLSINRTEAKIKESRNYCQILIEDVKKYIDNCSKHIIARKGKKINTILKTIITKESHEPVMVDVWELDEELKILNGPEYKIQ